VTIPLAYFLGCVTIPAVFVGGRLVGHALGYAHKVRWL
jgi:hypothetical protein